MEAPRASTLQKFNKAFKTDSQRSAFSVFFSLSVYGTMA
ncbi:unknow [Vibrio parahaemolyticus]|nr:unknow [Vibrio parahaemolyticus]